MYVLTCVDLSALASDAPLILLWDDGLRRSRAALDRWRRKLFLFWDSLEPSACHCGPQTHAGLNQPWVFPKWSTKRWTYVKSVEGSRQVPASYCNFHNYIRKPLILTEQQPPGCWSRSARNCSSSSGHSRQRLPYYNVQLYSRNKHFYNLFRRYVLSL